MSEQLGNIFLFCALITLLGIVILVFIHLYEIFEEPTIQKRMRKLRKPVQPWVTVLLYSCNDKALVEPSLKALLRSRYHNFDVVVINDRSGDAAKALKKGYRKSKRGEIVLALQAGVIVSPSFVKRAVATKGERKRISLRINETPSLSSLTEIIQTLNGIMWQRAYKVRISTVDTMLAIKNPARLDFLLVLMFVAIVVASLAVQEPMIIWYSWVIITSYLLAVIWLKNEKIKAKIQLTFSAFSALFLLPAAGVVMIFSQRHSRNKSI